MDYEKLIELVREYKVLYDLSNSKYSDNRHKEDIWKEIAEKMNASVPLCKKTWTNLRDSFRRAIKKRAETTSGQSAKTVRKWKLEDQMSFLKSYFQERPTVSNIEIGENSSNEENEDEGTDQNVEHEEEAVENISATLTERPEPHTDITKKESKRKSTKRHRSEESASSVLMKYILESKNEKKTEPDATDAFMSGIKATLKSFTPYYLNVAKQKIFSIVNELEFEQIMNSTETPLQAASRNTGHGYSQERQSSTPHSVDSSQSHISYYSSGTSSHLQSPPARTETNIESNTSQNLPGSSTVNTYNQNPSCATYLKHFTGQE